jgi:hypothetical protein
LTINSLLNFGVPGTASTDRAAPLQPIMSNKFRITFYDFGDTSKPVPYVMTQQLRSTNLPTLNFATQTLYAYVSTVYIATRAEWAEMSIRFLDDITNGVMKQALDQVGKQQNMYDQVSNRAGENYKFEMDLDVLAGGATAGTSANDPNILRRYSYSGCFVTALNGSEMAYATPDGIEFEMRIRYDNVVAFDGTGIRMGQLSDANNILQRSGTSTTGIGSQASGVSTNSTSVTVPAITQTIT